MTADLDEAERPRTGRPSRRGSVRPGGSGALLLGVHDHLRQELDRVAELVEQVAAGAADPAAARSAINAMTLRQNEWTLGAFCVSYCRVLTVHHAIEDQHMFAELRAGDATLGPVVDRLVAEHEVVAEVLTALDEALVAMVTDPARLPDVTAAVARLRTVLLSHLAYEEDELLGPLDDLAIRI